MAFPQSALGVRVALGLGGWVDVTSDVLVRDTITVQRGRADEAGQVDASSCSLSLKNQTGKYSPRNPTSPYYGLIGRNTPLRVGIGVPPLGAGTAGQTGTSIVAPSLTADTAGVHFVFYGAAPAGNLTMPAGYTAGTERDGSLSTWNGAYKAVGLGATGTATATFSVAATAAAALSVFVPGSGVSVVGFSGVVGVAGDHSIINGAAVTAGDYVLAVVGRSSDPDDSLVNIPVDADGTCRWSLVADTGVSAGPRMKAYLRRVNTTGSLDIGAWGSFHGGQDTYIRAYVITSAFDWDQRFTGEVSSFPARWDPSGADVYDPIQGAGILRRLGQGAAPLRSTLTRELLATAGLVALWPLEDAENATSFASATGGPAMQITGSGVFGAVNPTPAADDGFACADPLPTFTSTAGVRGVVPTYTTTSEWSVGALVSLPTSSTGESVLLTVTSTGSAKQWTVKYYAVGNTGFRIEALDGDGASLLNSGATVTSTEPVPAGSRFHLMLSAKQNGANVDWSLKYRPILPGATTMNVTTWSGSIATQTVSRVTAVQLGGQTDVPLLGDVTFGHAAATSAYEGQLGPPSGTGALLAWLGELAHTRCARLCQEEGVPVYVELTPAVFTRMGTQRPLTLLEILREVEATDGGVLYEPRGVVGLGFRSRSSKYDQAASPTLSYTGKHIAPPLEPDDDDRGIRNDVTVTRTGGSSARQVLEVGPLSVLAPPAGVGRYDTSEEINPQTDASLPDHAGWRLHVGTWDEARYPVVNVDLAAAPSLTTTVPALDVGDRFALSDLPAWLPPGGADLIAEGFTERIGLMADWSIAINATPGRVYDVAKLDTTAYARLDSENSTLTGGPYASGATSLSVAVATGYALWTTTATRPGDFPFDIAVAGEQMTATAISGTSSPQSFTVTRSVNGVVKAQASGAQVRLHRPVALPL